MINAHSDGGTVDRVSLEADIITLGFCRHLVQP